MMALTGNWFGKRYRGLVLGIWNTCASFGNILGTAIPAIWGTDGSPWCVYENVYLAIL